MPDLKRGSLLIEDRCYSKPKFLKAAKEAGIDLVVRLRDSVGKKLVGNDSQDSVEQIVEWEAQTANKEKIQVRGKVVKYVSQIKGYRSSEYYFFTTDESLTLEEVAGICLQRVRVEVFIRDVKQTLKMFFIKSKTADNIKKEIYLAYLTFNLVRSVMEETARIEPLRIVA